MFSSDRNQAAAKNMQRSIRPSDLCKQSPKGPKAPTQLHGAPSRTPEVRTFLS